MDKKTDVEAIARLARITVSEQEKKALGDQLSKILDYVDQLKKLDVQGVLPLRGLHLGTDIFRKDEVKPCSCQEDILKNSPGRKLDYFKIPKVIE